MPLNPDETLKTGMRFLDKTERKQLIGFMLIAFVAMGWVIWGLLGSKDETYGNVIKVRDEIIKQQAKTIVDLQLQLTNQIDKNIECYNARMHDKDSVDYRLKKITEKINQ